MPNLTTLLAIAVFTPALAGCLLLLSWLHHRRIVALAVWGSGFIIASVAATLIIVARGTIPNFWSIIVGNSIFAQPLSLSRRVLAQDQRQRGPKVYSLHAPEVECIGKGKAHRPYEFGVKVSVATTAHRSKDVVRIEEDSYKLRMLTSPPTSPS